MIEFKEYRGNKLTKPEEDFIIDIFNNLQYADSYHYNLQLIYNNSTHFTTVSSNFNLCTAKSINNILDIVYHDTEILTVIGNIHHNSHTSHLLFNANNHRPMFVEDTYIKLQDSEGNKYHFLINPPRLTPPGLYYIYNNDECDDSTFFISPNL
jgi:hypothetical protein